MSMIISSKPVPAGVTVHPVPLAFGLAYNLLFEQRAAVTPGLTREQYEAWLVATVKDKAKAAKGKK